MGWQDRDYARVSPAAGPLRRIHRPWLVGGSIVTTLIVINVVIYVLASLSAGLRELFYGLGQMQGLAVSHGQLWRLITAQYLHAGPGHLLINMLVLHFLGRPLERMWSTNRFLAVYTVGGLAGNVFYTILGSWGWLDPRWPAVGASGCIYTLLGIVAVLFPTATVYVYFLFPIRIRTAAIIFGGIALLRVLQQAANYGGEACHLAGLVFGVWWAMKGDAWWSRTEWRLPRTERMSRSRDQTTGFEARIAERREDAETIDRILKKVYDGGIHTLTEAEKQALREATERQRHREEEAGRIDRL